MADVMEALRRKTVTHTTGPGPIPTVVPSEPIIQQAGATGHHTLWVVFVIMFVSTVIFAALAYRTPVQKRLFHIITAFITTFATISYFAMASGDGNSFTHIVKHHSHKGGIPDTQQDIYRQVFFARYIDWSVTTPLLLLDLALLAGLNGANILVAIVADVIMILTGMFAAYAQEGATRWAYYAMSCAAFLVVIYLLAVPGRRNALARDQKTASFFTSIGLFTLILWTAYPIVWGIGDGARRMGVDAEILCYAVLDVLAKPVFGIWLLFTHDRMPSTNLNLEGVWAHGFGKREGTLRVGDDDDGA
ncbi:MAG: hypothetical protein M1823_004874 [Watsoniomyces obsoletus]|nr:MAG: hypothetical protein M1823_004874 [Watsoniomyces obsoletus]